MSETVEKPSWLSGTVMVTGRYRMKQGWMASNGQSHPISILQQLVCQTGGGPGWWVDVPTVPLETSDAK